MFTDSDLSCFKKSFNQFNPLNLQTQSHQQIAAMQEKNSTGNPFKFVIDQLGLVNQQFSKQVLHYIQVPLKFLAVNLKINYVMRNFATFFATNKKKP